MASCVLFEMGWFLERTIHRLDMGSQGRYRRYGFAVKGEGTGLYPYVEETLWIWERRLVLVGMRDLGRLDNWTDWVSRETFQAFIKTRFAE